VITDIPRLLDALGIKVKKRGRNNLWSSCPYPGHRDSDPSWSIRLGPGGAAGSNHCHGCKRGGGPLDLIAAVRNFASIRQAFEWAREHSLTTEGAVAPQDLKLTIRGAISGSFELPPEVLVRPLDQWVTPARRYAEKRGITADEVERWGIGYAVDGRLGGRIVFPISDELGRVVSYDSRPFTGESPRYMGPAEREQASPGAIWGERYWPAQSERSGATLVICEGILNALACVRARAQYVAALSGSSYDPWVVMKLIGFGSLVIATDLDLAGEAIAGELRSAFVRHRSTRRVEFPAGDDPADIWVRDPGELRGLLWG